MSCGQACDGCNERAQHHLCPACANEDIDNLKKELREARESHSSDRAGWDEAAEKMESLMQGLVKSREEARAEVAKLRAALAEVDRIAGEMEEAAAPHGYTGQMVRTHSKWAAKIAEALDPVRVP